MFRIGIAVILHGLLFGVQSLPRSQHHVSGRSGVQSPFMNLQQDLKATIHRRYPRDIRLLKLRDPLDCLSQVVCGLNTYPPQKPSVRTSTANDFAFLLRNSIAKLRSQKLTTTTTTAAPSTKRTTPKAALDDDNEEYDSESIENDLDYEADEVEDYYNGPPSRTGTGGRRNHKQQNRVKRYSIFNKRRGDDEQQSRKHKQSNKKGKFAGKTSTGKYQPQYSQNYKNFPPNKARPLTPLQRLRMETDLRAKLLSDAQCPDVGLIDHSCPFNYQQMLVLISTSLERQRTVSFTSNKVLPMVGYLIKSRNYTGTLQATFTAIERINNYTLENDREGKPIDFTHILDEMMNRVTGDAGLRIVDTSNDSGSASVWEDDEFDHVLQNQYERKRPQSADIYKLGKKKKKEQELKKKQKQKGSGSVEQADDQSTTSEEDTSEEGLIFDRPRPPPSNGPGGGGDGESSSEEEEAEVNKVVNKKKKFTGDKESLVPPPVFGHLQKNAEDE